MDRPFINRPRPLSDMVSGLTKDIFGKKNLLFGKMLAQWTEIAGADVAARTVPLDLKFQRPKKGSKEAGKAVLHLAVQSAYALELSYQKNLLIERLNMFFGYSAISDIKIVQNSEVMNNKKHKPPLLRPVPLAEQQKIDQLVGGIQENDLQTALKNLGKAIASRKETPKE